MNASIVNTDGTHPRDLGKQVGEMYVNLVKNFRYFKYDPKKRMFVKAAPLKDTRTTDPAGFERERKRMIGEKKVAMTMIKFVAFIVAETKEDQKDIMDDAFERKHEMMEMQMKVSQGLPSLGGFSVHNGEEAAGEKLREHYLRYKVVFENAAAIIDKRLKIS